MTDIQCVNEECAQYQVRCTNPFDLPVEDIICGTCGELTQPAPDAPPEG